MPTTITTADDPRLSDYVALTDVALRRRLEDARTMRQTGRPTLPVTLAGEATTNPFLRVDEDALITAVTHRLGRAPADRVETFATLRQWKNDFRA